MRPPLRIAILECDTPIESVDKRYNGYYGLFSQLFHECAKSLGLDPETGLDITRWDVVHAQEYPKLEDIDAIVHTGSSKSPDCPTNVIPLGSSSNCAIQGMYRPGKFITVQGHPEFNGFIVSEVVNKRARAGVFPKELSDDALARVELAHDGLDILVVFLRFLLGEIE
ncbi:unnamed protein product [Aspergillus oryzae var. brunneus]|uniref:Unnamed protein product n=2 Tax=Aspergillus oryzae TaxID=5062 RepID=A0AAN4YBW7_ASPOZ|nr:unnamed protein product [Aspergillus oryzae]GMG25102.1 unnamed protein product [Aspergillus oryzae]GMG44985.1 unnamed protein product [Aspergillus oryzae var. brunneus]